MASNSDKYLVIGRPSQQDYEQRCASNDATVSPCGSLGTPCHSPVAPHDRQLSARPHREKVREDIKDAVMLTLGAPIIKLELDEQALDLAVDETLMIFEEYAGQEFFDYYTFRTIGGKSVYKMPDDVGIIRNVYYKKAPQFAFQSQDLNGAIPIEYFYPGGAYSSIQGGLIDPIQPIWGRMGEWVLYKQYEQMYSRVSSQIGGWEWVGDLNYIKLYPIPSHSQYVMVHYLQKCKDWKQINQAMIDGALAHAMIILGNIRGKYQSPPGPGGGMQLDGEYMRTKGWELKEKWQNDLIYKFGDILGITLD